MDKMLTTQVSGSEFGCLDPMEMPDRYGNLPVTPALEKPRLRTPGSRQLAKLSKSVSSRLKGETLCTCMRVHMFIFTCVCKPEETLGVFYGFIPPNVLA